MTLILAIGKVMIKGGSHSSQYSAEGGFTLLELLLVLTLIGFFSGMVMLAAPDNSQRSSEMLAHQTQRLIDRTSLHAVESQISYGLQVERNSLKLMEYAYHQGKLMWTDSKQQFGALILPPNLEFHYRQGKSANPRTAASLRASIAGSPNVMLYPNGELSPFAIRIRATNSAQSKGSTFEVSSDGFNTRVDGV